MTDPIPDTDKDRPNQNISEGAVPTDIGKVQADEAIGTTGQSQSTSQETNKPNKRWMEWRIFKIPRKWWDALKDNANTNRAIAVATIVIAISALVQIGVAIAQWEEMKSGGKQTQTIIDTAQKIQDALDTANIRNGRAFRRTLDQSRNAMDASNNQSKAVLDATIKSAQLDESPPCQHP